MTKPIIYIDTDNLNILMESEYGDPQGKTDLTVEYTDIPYWAVLHFTETGKTVTVYRRPDLHTPKEEIPTRLGQVTDNGGYIRRYDNAAYCERSLDGTTSVVTQRNKFWVGDTLDVLPPDGNPFLIRCLSLTNAQGERVDSAPHPMEELVLEADRAVPAGSVLRRKREQ